MSSLFVSPHADDVCLSVGALSHHVLSDKHLVTVFSTSSWVEPGMGPGGTEAEVTAVRQREDREFCSLVGFRYHHLGMADSCVRHDGRGDLRVATGHERNLERHASLELLALARKQDARVLVGPLGLGGHADHIVCRKATLRVAAKMGVPALLYEDLPYADEISLPRIWFKAWFRHGLVPIVCKTCVTSHRKRELALTYESQRNESILRAVTSHSERLAARYAPSEEREDYVFERLWTTKAASSLGTLLDTPIEVDARSGGLLGAVARLGAGGDETRSSAPRATG